MTGRHLALIAAAGSLALLGGALAFQYIGGLPPCKLCYWQRYPHAAAIAIGVVLLVVPMRALTLLGAAAAAVTAGVGIYHTGVERLWWEGPNTCTSNSDIGAMNTQDLLNQILEAPVIRCDDVLWSLAGLSMASWNAILSAGLAVLWIAAWRRWNAA